MFFGTLGLEIGALDALGTDKKKKARSTNIQHIFVKSPFILEINEWFVWESLYKLLGMAFNFPAFSYIIALIVDAFLIFFAIFHVSILYSFVFIALKLFLGYVSLICIPTTTVVVIIKQYTVTI